MNLSAGTCAVPQLLATAVNGRRSMLALSSRAWLGYSDQGRYNLSPLSFEALDYASSALPHLRHDSCSYSWVVCCGIAGRTILNGVSSDNHLTIAAGFASEQCPEGFVAVVKSSLRILMLERLGETFNQTSVPLRYTPRGFAIDEANKVVLARCFCCLFFHMVSAASVSTMFSDFIETGQHDIAPFFAAALCCRGRPRSRSTGRPA
jgi:hypothetical protein